MKNPEKAVRRVRALQLYEKWNEYFEGRDLSYKWRDKGTMSGRERQRVFEKWNVVLIRAIEATKARRAEANAQNERVQSEGATATHAPPMATAIVSSADGRPMSVERKTRRSRARFLMVGQAPEAHPNGTNGTSIHTHGNDIPGLRVLARRTHAGCFLKKRIKMGARVNSVRRYRR